jgi:hypothetical protein
MVWGLLWYGDWYGMGTVPLSAEGGKYVGLVSLDLICDSTDSFKEWMEGVSNTTSQPLSLDNHMIIT